MNDESDENTEKTEDKNNENGRFVEKQKGQNARVRKQ